LEDELQAILLKEAKQNPNLGFSLRLGNCQLCEQYLVGSYNYFERHILDKHYDIFRKYILHPDDIYLECKICGQKIRNNLNEMSKQHGEEHYYSLPEDLKKRYDKWKAEGFPNIRTDYDL
jgi:hypothetical protein